MYYIHQIENFADHLGEGRGGVRREVRGEGGVREGWGEGRGEGGVG